MTATVRRVARPRGSLTPDQRRRLERGAEKRDAAEAAYRAEVLAVMAEGASFAEVAHATGGVSRYANVAGAAMFSPWWN